MKKHGFKVFALVVVAAFGLCACQKDEQQEESTATQKPTSVQQETEPETEEVFEGVIAPVEAEYGYYVDIYMRNTASNNKVDYNPSVGVLSKYLELWTPGSNWNDGIVLNQEIISENIRKSYEIAGARTEEEEKIAFENEFNNQNYSMIYGLGSYAEKFIEKSGLNDDKTDWKADVTGEAYSVVGLISVMRGTGASTEPAKKYYVFPRPYRWSSDGTVLIQDGYDEEQIADGIAEGKSLDSRDPISDGGFPSGHTNAGYIAAFGYAASMPELYSDIILYAAEFSNTRIQAGMHSPLDVMGGRITATAISASALCADKNQQAIESAYRVAHEAVLDDYIIEAAGKDDYSTYKENLAKYNGYLTYGFKQIDDTTLPMKVPKGAEALLKSRYPYMTNSQIRYVLYSTGIASGYPVLDDEEGWGRLNMYAAANGYGAFDETVEITMDGSKDGFNKLDNWLNDIGGTGSLVKKGTGTLVLAGNNTYSGGTVISEGCLMTSSTKALGTGNVTVEKEGNLTVNIEAQADALIIEGTLKAEGQLVVNFTNGYAPKGNVEIVTAKAIEGQFSQVTINGAENSKVSYDGGKIIVNIP